MICASGWAETPSPLTYEQHIRPIFRAHCFDCHGAAKDFKGKLDLRLVRHMKRGGESGPAIVAGKPGESYLLERVRSGEMPPGDARLSATEIQTLERWIAGGAPTARPEPESIGPGIGITPEERSFWSFQPIRRPVAPKFAADQRIRTPIDALLRKAMPTGLSLSADADRITLIKRLYFDLIGLPPSPDAVQKWTTDTSSDWFERLVDELLASEHYGERWARHWLDVAGYADSEGYAVQDSPRPWAWKYRDYVIRSLNADKPFDRFLTEQLAGDEISPPRDGDLSKQQIELLAATGFLRMAADGTGSGSDNAVARNRVMSDTIRIVSTSLLGLSVGCAQCHDHRYDPIPHTDYYALRAIFEPALDWKKWRQPNQRRVSLYTQADRKRAAELEAEAQKQAAEKNQKQKVYMAEALEQELKKYKDPLRGQLKAAYTTPGNQRSAEQKALLKKHPSVNISPGVLYQYLPKRAEELKAYDKRIADIRAKKPKEEFLRVLQEPAGHAPETRLFHRGDHEQPREVVLPAGLSVVGVDGQPEQFVPNDSTLKSTGRRLAFSKWLTSGKNPLFQRVIVNRIWMHHFGRGIVDTPADFGVLGMRPTHPEVLDWLADEFRKSGWSLKKLHKLIVSSTVWRQTSEPNTAMSAIDPENRFYWRKPIVRLEAETIRDRMLSVAGKLDRKLYGPPAAVKEDETGQVIVDGGQTRRSLYVTVRRSQPVAMMQAFDAPVMDTNCESRPTSTVATQSLMLLNGAFTLDHARSLANRCVKEARIPSGNEHAKLLAEIPKRSQGPWRYGYGQFKPKSDEVEFTQFEKWNGSRWQGGETVPDPMLGFVFLTSTGGHPDILERAVIRRWKAPRGGTLSIDGTLNHASKNGNGVRGTIVSSRSGKAGEWMAHHSSVNTNATGLQVEPGDVVDLICDCNGNHTSDSFSWTAKLTLKTNGRSDLVFESSKEFAGPISSPGKLLGEVERAWELAFCRRPTAGETELALAFLVTQIRYLDQHPSQLGKGIRAESQSLTNLCQTLISSNEFLYVD